MDHTGTENVVWRILTTPGAAHKPSLTGPVRDCISPLIEKSVSRSHMTGKWGYCSDDCVTESNRSDNDFFYFSVFGSILLTIISRYFDI